MSHWTRELFEGYPELFLEAFEERLDRAPAEVDTLLRYLNEQVFEPKRVLDLNCGIGRHSVELGRRGIEVLGTDLSPSYIAIAKRTAQEKNVIDKVEFQVADVREIASKLSKREPFDGIICLWTSFGFYDDETNDNILRQCLGLVRPGGFFALDVVNRDWLIHNFSERGFRRSKNRIVLEERQFSPLNSRNYNTWTFLKQTDETTFILEKSLRLDHRIWSLHELVVLFEKTGWRFKVAYPGFFPGSTERKADSLSQEEEVLKTRQLLVISYRPGAES